jgi:alpha-1,6-mannosyltransferase
MPTLRSFFTRSPNSQLAILVVAAAILEAMYARLHHYRNLEFFVVETIAAGLLGGVVYFFVIFGLEHTPESRISVWLLVAAGILFRVTLWPLAPTLSSDMYRYRWDGQAQLRGLNPYLVQPDDPNLGGMLNVADDYELRMPATDMPTIYPPLAEQVFKFTARYLPATAAFKLPMELCDVCVMILLALWLRAEGGRAYQLAIYAWNPLVIVEFAGSGHSDALALAALVGAFVIIKSRRTVSTLLLAVATLLKSFPILLFPLWLRRNGWPRSLRAWMEGTAAAALAAICAWPYRAAFHQIPITMATFERNWQDNNASLYTMLKLFSDSHEFAAGIGVGVAVGLTIWTALRKFEPTRATFWIFGSVLLFSPNAYPWYFTWVIPFICFNFNPAWLLLSILQFLSYKVLIEYQDYGIFNFDPRYLAATYLPFYALLLWQVLRKKSAPPAAQAELRSTQI